MSAPPVTFPEFPESAFTGLFATHRSVFRPTTTAPDAFQFAAMAASLSFLLGRDTWLASAAGRLLPNINVALVGDTGTFKSTTLDDTNSFVTTPFLSPPSPNGPSRMHLFDGAGTGEGFLQAIADDPTCETAAPGGKRALVTFHELAELLGKIRRDQAGNLQDVLLASLDARPVLTHVTRGKTLRVTNGLLVVQSASTFENLASALSVGANTSGFMNRMLWFGGTSSRRLARRPPADQALLQKLLHDLHGVLMLAHGKEMEVEIAADALHEQLDAAWQEDTTMSGALRLATKRAGVQALKLAMLLALANGRLRVRADDVRTGWEVVRYCRHAVLRLVDAIPAAAYGELEDRVNEKGVELAAISLDGTFTQSQVHQRLKSKKLGWNEIDRAFKAVIKRGDFLAVEDAERYRIARRNDDAPASPAAPPQAPPIKKGGDWLKVPEVKPIIGMAPPLPAGTATAPPAPASILPAPPVAAASYQPAPVAPVAPVVAAPPVPFTPATQPTPLPFTPAAPAAPVTSVAPPPPTLATSVAPVAPATPPPPEPFIPVAPSVPAAPAAPPAPVPAEPFTVKRSRKRKASP